jgi:hypothetical protein
MKVELSHRPSALRGPHHRLSVLGGHDVTEIPPLWGAGGRTNQHCDGGSAARIWDNSWNGRFQ